VKLVFAPIKKNLITILLYAVRCCIYVYYTLYINKKYRHIYM